MAQSRPLAWRPGETYYVIVGWGLTAAVNCTALLATNHERLGQWPILLIGDAEPWARYYALNMGQWPSVLSPPGFRHRCHAVRQEQFLNSREFAAAISRQWLHLIRRRPLYSLRGRVTAIRQAGQEFELDCSGGQTVRAACIDVCGGPGPARYLSSPPVDARLLPYPGLPPAPPGYRLLESGESFLENSTAVASGHRIAVIGGGPTGAWCVERALAEGCEVVWVSQEELNPAFVSSGRNDWLAHGPLVRGKSGGLTIVFGNVFPASPRVRFAEGYEVRSINPHDGGLAIDFQPAKHAVFQRYVDHLSSNLALQSPEIFAQAVLAIGQATDRSEPASWAHLLQPFLRPAFISGQHFIVDRSDWMEVGLQSMDGKLRVLGAAFLAHPDLQARLTNQRSPLFQYLRSLPEQAQVDRGAAMSSFTTAKANGYFQHRINRNRNFATLDHLRLIPNLDREHAARWHAIRAQRIHPLPDAELQGLLRDTRDRYDRM